MRTTSSEYGRRDLDAILAELWQRCSEEQLQQSIDRVVDNAMGRIALPESQSLSCTAFHGILGEFLQSVYTGLDLPCSTARARDEALQKLEQYYARAGDGGYALARLAVADEGAAGLEQVLLAIANGIKAELRAGRIDATIRHLVGGLSMARKAAVVAALLERQRDQSPSRLSDWPSALLTDQLPALLQSELASQQAVRHQLRP